MYYHYEKRVLFIGVSCSGSTAIGEELRLNYGFEQIAHKHCNYRYFEKFLNKGHRKPLHVILVSRDPVDKARSVYIKLMNDHRSQFSNKDFHLESGGNVSKKMINLRNKLIKENISFSEYLKKRYAFFGYYDDLLYNLKHATHIIDFNNMRSDFESSLRKIGFTINSELSTQNKTKKNIQTKLEKNIKEKIFRNYLLYTNKVQKNHLFSINYFIFKIFIFIAEIKRTSVEKKLYLNWLMKKNKQFNS